MIFAINYANEKYKKSQRFNTATAIRKGKADKVFSYSPRDIDDDFRRKNADILKRKRGNGYWLWKPYLILKTLNRMQEGDYLVYLDSGAFYVNNIRYLINQMESDGQCIMSFELPFKERIYTKRDTFIQMDCDVKAYTESNQRMATMIVFQKTARSIRFVEEWLDYGQQENIITDDDNHFGKKNYPGFIDHRHDQSIFSLLSKKYGLKAYRDPSQFGRYPNLFWKKNVGITAADYSDCKYPQIIAEHRGCAVTRKIYREQMVFAHAPQKIAELYLLHIAREPDKGERIAVLTDNMPIKEEAYGFGMYKVVNRLLLALNKNVEMIICTDRIYDAEKTDAQIADKIVPANRFHLIEHDLFKNLSFLAQMTEMMIHLRRRGVYKVFVPLGADYHELQRAYLLKKFFHVKVSAFIVDDFLEYQNRILKNKLYNRKLERNIIRYICAIDTVFVISKGMQERIVSLTGRKSIIIPLPYEYRSVRESDDARKDQILFVGNINSLYITGLRDIAEIIDQMNEETGRDIKLAFTYKSKSEVKKVVGNYECIVSRRFDEEDALQQEMRNSLFCFMPYSDSEEYCLMQNTSFPSKLVEYMSAARSIVIYGNAENSAQDYFERNHLREVICGRDRSELKRIIRQHIDEKVDYSKEYQKILKEKHSFQKVNRKILLYV